MHVERQLATIACTSPLLFSFEYHKRKTIGQPHYVQDLCCTLASGISAGPVTWLALPSDHRSIQTSKIDQLTGFPSVSRPSIARRGTASLLILDDRRQRRVFFALPIRSLPLLRRRKWLTNELIDATAANLPWRKYPPQC
jgi:hypothetical protein